MRFTDDDFPTLSSVDQLDVLEDLLSLPPLLSLDITQHAQYLSKTLDQSLSRHFVSLDASRPWIIYWILHALDLLNIQITESQKTRAIHTLASFQHAQGGFGGGPGQIPHLAPTFASVHALAILGSSEAFEIINVPNMIAFLSRLKDPDGSFRMHQEGEVDVRFVLTF